MTASPSLKRRIKDGEVVHGVGASIDATREQLEDIRSRRDCDYFYLDSQHTAFSEEKLVAFCAAAEAMDMPVHLRIKHTRHTYLIGNLLDLGPTGIVVPQVEDEATVDEAVDMFYYPQQGRRSWGGQARRGIAARPDRLAYAAWWNACGVLWLQLESINAVTNARRLARPGVDVLTFGPNDLMYSIEAYPAHPFRTVDDCIRHVIEQMAGTDIRIGMAVHAPGDYDRYRAMGVTVLQAPP